VGGYADYSRAAALKRRTFERVLDRSLPSAGVAGRLLDIGTAHGLLLDLAAARGWRTAGIEPNPAAAAAARGSGHEVATGALPEALEGIGGWFDLISMLDVLEHMRDPLAELRRLRGRLRPGGRLVIVAPDYGGLSRRVMGAHWPHFKREHLWYFRRRTMRRILREAGYSPFFVRPFFKTMSVRYLAADFSRHEGAVGLLSRELLRWLPGAADWPMPLYLDELIAVAGI
jgi:SAM-dependent methyltransferase